MALPALAEDLSSVPAPTSGGSQTPPAAGALIRPSGLPGLHSHTQVHTQMHTDTHD